MKIALAGFGAEGKASYEYWNTAEHQVVIVDEHEIAPADLPLDAQTIIGEGAFTRLNGFDLVVRSPGIHPNHIVTDGKIWSATNEFFAQSPAQIIGVTGTKGKGTTSSLIASILEAAGKTVHLVGNIGTPALSVLPHISADDVVVYEMSSFQLWDIERAPHVAVVLMIEPDHLNVHDDFDDYVEAKANIARFQRETDVIVYYERNRYATHIAQYSEATMRIPYPFDISSVVSSLRLVGQHNIENASAAIAAVRPFVTDEDTIRRGLASFAGLPHRIEFVRERAGVSYYNDSFSSAPSATVAAIRSFTQPEILVIGGVDKGADFSELRDELVRASNVKTILLIGEIRHKLAEAFVDAPIRVCDATTMDEIIAAIQDEVSEGDVVIFSPACASFDMFKNFYDRGDQFRTAVQAL